MLVCIIAASVSGRHHHDDTGLPSCFHGLAKRIDGIAFKNRASQREVNYFDVILRLQFNRSLNPRDHNAVRAGAGIVEHHQVDQVDSGGDSGVDAIRLAAISAYDSSDVRSVAIGVVRRAPIDEVLRVDYPGSTGIA